MRDLMVASFLVILVPLAFYRPFVAYLLWGWTALLIPTNYLYGFLSGGRFNFLFAILTLVLVMFGRVKGVPYQFNRTTGLMLLFTVHVSLSVLFGYGGNPHNAYYYEIFLKAMVYCLLAPLFLTTRLRLHAMLLMVALGFGFHGVVIGLKLISSGGGHIVAGPSGSMLYDRNHLSTALALALPILYYLSMHSARKWVKLGLLAAFGLSAFTIMGSGSRGGFVALAVTGLWLVKTSRRKFVTLFVVGCLGILFYAFAPESWLERLETIEHAEEDASFVGRLIAWKISSAIAVSNPLFGGGLHAVQVQYVWDQFVGSQGLLGFISTPLPTFSAKAAHSIYFEVMGDLGLVGFVLFMVLLLNGLYARREIRRLLAGTGKRYQWATDMADMLMLSVVAYMVGGLFVSLAYLEAIYMVLVIIEMLRQYALKIVAIESGRPAVPGVPVMRAR
jgi:probable O-glycosylation ligase (exosortase A-associated)